MCKHIYEYVGNDICPNCGKDTHEPNWQLLLKQRKEHREKFGIFYNTREWWSI